MNITATQVKELRQATGAGMMDCKKALKECEGDMEEAKVYLRKKGIADSAKRAGRTASRRGWPSRAPLRNATPWRRADAS